MDLRNPPRFRSSPALLLFCPQPDLYCCRVVFWLCCFGLCLHFGSICIASCSAKRKRCIFLFCPIEPALRLCGGIYLPPLLHFRFRSSPCLFRSCSSFVGIGCMCCCHCVFPCLFWACLSVYYQSSMVLRIPQMDE